MNVTGKLLAAKNHIYCFNVLSSNFSHLNKWEKLTALSFLQSDITSTNVEIINCNFDKKPFELPEEAKINKSIESIIKKIVNPSNKRNQKNTRTKRHFENTYNVPVEVNVLEPGDIFFVLDNFGTEPEVLAVKSIGMEPYVNSYVSYMQLLLNKKTYYLVLFYVEHKLLHKLKSSVGRTLKSSIVQHMVNHSLEEQFRILQ